MSAIKEKLKKNIKTVIFLSVLFAAFCNHYYFITEVRDSHYAATFARKDITMPPSLTLVTVALGPIRGLIVDALWWKVSELQEAGEYFEIIRITDWITVLQPNNSFVWTYHSWNLAYNIAYEFPTAETRWKWVYSGVKLLRDEGLKLNPNDDFIKSELAWLFLDRIGGYSDFSRLYFIKQWAEIMKRYLPVGDKIDIERLANPKTEEDAKLAFEMKEKLNLDPEKMLKIDKLYGPFQWRLPQAQAVYWGAKKDFSSYSQGYLNYRITVIAAMQQAFVAGGLIEDKKAGLFVITNNLDLTESIINYYKKQIAVSDNKHKEKNMFRDFIVHSAPILYGFDRKESARKLFEAYKEISPIQNDVDFKNFIGNNLLRMSEKAPARYQQSLVELSLFNGYIYLAQGDFKQAAKFADKAEDRWKKHQSKFSSNKIMQMPSFEDVKAAAFVKILNKFPVDRRTQLLDLVHNKLADKLRIDTELKFSKYLGK